MRTQAKQILLVDDEEKLLESIARRLELMGFMPLTATSGRAALDIAANNPIDLAIVDLQMPDMNGLVTITKLKEIRPSLKTMLLTGHGNEKIKQATESLATLDLAIFPANLIARFEDLVAEALVISFSMMKGRANRSGRSRSD